jgi:hypothetical protein
VAVAHAGHAGHAASVPTPQMRATTSAKKKKTGAHVAHAAPDPRQTQLYSR